MNGHEKATAENLREALEALTYDPEAAAEVFVEFLENAAIDVTRLRISTYEEAGMMTMNAGVVLSDGRSQVQLTVHTRPR